MNERKIKSGFLSGLVIGVITYVICVTLNKLFNLISTSLVPKDLVNLIASVYNVISMTIGFFVAGIIMFKLIEKIKFKTGKTILIALFISIIYRAVRMVCLAVVMREMVGTYILVVSNVLFYVLLLLGGLWINAVNTAELKVPTVDGGVVNMAEYGRGYFNMAAHILLLIFTGGIWLFRWIYRTTKFLNCVPGEKRRSPVAKWLLCLLVPFYYIYWTYVSAGRIDKLAKSVGVHSDISTLSLVFAIFMPIISYIIMQDKINSIVATGKKVATEGIQPTTEGAKPVAPANTSNADELKKYKELLDMGAITQEEYEAKKKQLLGL